MKKWILILLFLCAAAPASIFINSFNSGRLSKDLKVRADLERHTMGSETLTNILIRPQGMAYKRPGTEFIDYRIQDVNITSTGEYPTLQELTAAEIPDTPAEPADGALVAPTSVTTAIGLQAIAGAGHYTIDANIDLTGVTWTPIVGFRGKIEGNNYTISNLLITSVLGAVEQGLFGSLRTNTEIRNLNFESCTVTASETSSSVGILAGNTDYRQTNIILKNITFTDCYVKGHDHVGCLIGYMEQVDTSYVYNCNIVNCTIEGYPGGDNHGSLIGGLFTRILDSGDYSYIIKCSSQGGTVQISANSMGGLIGNAWVNFGAGLPTDALHSSGGIYDCNSSTSLSDSAAGFSVGGLIGSCQGFDVVSCYATGSIVSTGFGQNNVGGLIGSIGVGFNTGSDVTNCYSTGNITVPVGGRIGGFIGVARSRWTNITRCYSTGFITINGSADDWFSIGGFIGEIQNNYNSIIQRCWLTGDITISMAAKRYALYMGSVGGFTGLLVGTGSQIFTQEFLNCYSWSSIIYQDNATDVYTGGFLGSYYISPDYVATDIIFTNCYVAQTDSAAGNGYVNQLPQGSFTNGFYGYNLSDPNGFSSTAIFWDTDTSSILTDSYATGHVTDWMQTKTNYTDAGWDFTTIWVLDEEQEITTTLNLSGDTAIRLIPFEYATNDAYVLEFGHRYISFLRTTP